MAFFGPEPEFFIFDSVEWKVDMSGSYRKIFSEEAAWKLMPSTKAATRAIARRSRVATSGAAG